MKAPEIITQLADALRRMQTIGIKITSGAPMAEITDAPDEVRISMRAAPSITVHAYASTTRSGIDLAGTLKAQIGQAGAGFRAEYDDGIVLRILCPLERATYCGPDKKLAGRTAMVRWGRPVLAQFDDQDLRSEDDVCVSQEWHAFPGEHFRLIDE